MLTNEKGNEKLDKNSLIGKNFKGAYVGDLAERRHLDPIPNN